jgi:deoxyadenosine/deoxycytidine kinase
MTSIPRNAVIAVAGTVGAGKTSLTEALASALGFQASFEKVGGNPYLEAYYRDFKRWAFHMQVYFLAERFKEQKRIYEAGGGFVQDRSIYEDVDIFARMHYEKGNLTRVDYDTYVELYEAMVMTPYFPHPDVLIYLDGPIEDIIARIRGRGRTMEQETPVSYWKDLHERYKRWISDFDICPVLRVDLSDYDLHADPKAIESIISEIHHLLIQ